MCVDLTRCGIATWNIEYRRLGDPGGGWRGTFDDVLRAVEYVPELAREHRLDLDRVVLVGHSAGGQLALWAAARTRAPIRGVVSLAGVVDPHMLDSGGDDHGLARRLLGGGPADAPERWHEASPRLQLPWPVRTVLICGTADVHWKPNETSARAAHEGGSDVELVALEDAGHFELIDPRAREWIVVRTEIEKLLG
jgi:acetyl esterase/lipase